MKKIFFTLSTAVLSIAASAQFVATLELKEPISGLCNQKGVYVMLPSFKGQEEALCPVSKEDILKRLNAEVAFLKDKPDYTDKGMIGLVINCKGEVVQCKLITKRRVRNWTRK